MVAYQRLSIDCSSIGTVRRHAGASLPHGEWSVSGLSSAHLQTLSFCCFFLPRPKYLHKTERHQTMEICVKSFDGEKCTVEVDVDDTIEDIRQKVASAAGLCEDGFDMSFGGKALAEGDGVTQLSAGDTVVLTKMKSQKDDAIAALRDMGETDLTEWRFQGLADPKLIHFFLQAEVVTEIPNSFLHRGTFEELDLSGVSVVTTVKNSFLSGCNSLHTLDLSGWINVTQIGHSFLSRCTALRKLDLSGWNNVTQIGSYSLCDCSTLTTLDLSAWRSVTRIGDYFLSYCTGLRTADLSGWSNVTQIGIQFLSDCSTLTTLDISGWNNVERIPKAFLRNCTSLKTLDLSGWNNATHLMSGFLEGSKIRTSKINLTGSSSVVSEYLNDRSKCQCVCM